MAISTQQQIAIDKWFQDHKLTPKCGLCGGTTWKRDLVATLRATDPSNAGSIMATGPGMVRMLRLICAGCANVLLLDADRLSV